MVRVGITFSGGDSIVDVIRNSKLAEEEGFEIIWWGEDFFVRDGVSPLAAIALNTRRIKLGTGIISHYVHHPAAIATTIATLDEISCKRMVLGLGTGVSYWISYQMGIDQPKPLVAMRECVEIFKRLIEGKSITFEGKVFKCRNVKLGFDPPRKHIPIYLAAMGPKMLQLSGEIADGVIPAGAGASTKSTERCIRNIGVGAKRAGRSISDLDIQQFIISSVSDDSGRAKDSVREFVAWMVGSGGFKEEVFLLDGFEGDDVLPIIRKVTNGDIRGASKHVGDDMVDAFAAAGSPKEFRHRIRSYLEVGVNCAVILPVGSQDDIRVTIEEAGKLAGM